MSLRLTMFFDGGCRGDIAAGAAVLYDEDAEIVAEVGDFLSGEGLTSNVAEYHGLLAGLRQARRMGVTELEVYGDSELIVRQVSGVYRALNPRLRELRDRVWAEAEHFDRVSIRETMRGSRGRRRDNNAAADALANRCMDERASIHRDEIDLKEVIDMEEQKREMMEEPASDERGFAEPSEGGSPTGETPPVEPETPAEETPAEPEEGGQEGGETPATEESGDGGEAPATEE